MENLKHSIKDGGKIMGTDGDFDKWVGKSGDKMPSDVQQSIIDNSKQLV